MSIATLMFLIVLLGLLYVEYELLRKSQNTSARQIGKIAGGGFSIIFCLLVLVLRPLMFESAIIPSGSMRPTLEIGDRIFVNKLAYKHRDPRYGEVVTFTFPTDVPGKQTDDSLIKRVIGLPGDTIVVLNGHVYRNGQELDEPYIREPIEYDMGSITVPEGALFVLGDNRNESDDGHIWGVLDRKRITGKATIRFYPLDRAGRIR